jgi:heme/copper-type cytochrome/quinol oxidase subunit 3
MGVITTDSPSDPGYARARFIGARLLVAGDAFFFLGFLFAYLYLRALDSNGNWHPAHTDPSVVLGTITLVAVVAATAVLHFAGDQRLRSALTVALALVLVGVVCEGIQLFNPGFSPSHGGGYGAVFVGFAAGFLAHLLGAAYWLETVAVDSQATAEQQLIETRAALVFMTFLSGVAIVAYILLYLV